MACNFSDLSSIQAAEGHEMADLFRFVPVSGVDCAQSIPAAVQILHDIADHVVEQDEKKDQIARKRAMRLAISQAWTTAFNNQVSMAGLIANE